MRVVGGTRPTRSGAPLHTGTTACITVAPVLIIWLCIGLFNAPERFGAHPTDAER
jgi:hypothetical protein